MTAPCRILVPLDGSDEAEAILETIMPLARQPAVRLALFSAVESDHTRAEAEGWLARARAFLFRHGVEAATKVDRGEPARTIASNASPAETDLIAMSTYGRTGLRRVLMGSVASEVVRQANVPVIAARPGTRMDGWKHLVVGLDGSSRALEILGSAVQLASVLDATVHLLGVEDAGLSLVRGESTSDYLRRVASGLEVHGVRADISVRAGLASREIVRFAEGMRAGMIALATHGRSGMGGLLMGSVAGEVLASSACPVLLQRAAALQAAAVSVTPSDDRWMT